MNEKQIKQYERAKAYAISKGGVCLSDGFANRSDRMIWKCSNVNHIAWSASFKSVVAMQSWCRMCSNEQQSISRSNKDGLSMACGYAEAKGGKCLSSRYINRTGLLHWKCANANHDEWYATFANTVKQGRWCPQCSLSRKSESLINPNGLILAKAHAALKNGMCLSNSYSGTRGKMLWKCEKSEHKAWHAAYSDVVGKDTWCPECSSNKQSEKRTRLIFEKFFNQLFPSARPSWNINPWTRQYLELDGYCKEFNIAFEHDGEHHFKVVSYRGQRKTKKDLTYQKFKDEQKRLNCKKHSVLLINIPTIGRSDMAKFHPFLENVIKSCKQHGIDMSFDNDKLLELEISFYAT